MTKKAKYLFLDCETGGLDEKKHSLLTAFFLAVDEDLNEVGRLYLGVRPQDGTYKVTSGALKINKIDIVAHDEALASGADPKMLLVDFLTLHSGGGRDKLIPVGHNIQFDFGFIHSELLDKTTWEKFNSYRVLDTSIVANFLKFVNKLPQKQQTSLVKLAEYYGVTQDLISGAHNAIMDVQMTVAVLKKMKETLHHDDIIL